ncbi:PhzF family phenazine biosynthesis protein [Streptomyces sp. NPDC093252]|uniref:PhzF family phenazine biosynthesis protein n=1 Tax=Streptomyces sp. NPDC093252 TaxID=3154980 RepID=UPI0034272748
MSAARERPFVQVDVFGDRPCLGNPVAVVLDGTGLSTGRMQSLAAWTNLSETTFVLPPTVPGADYRLRILTPRGELPFAGHPTLGSARAWLDSGATGHRPDRVVQECAAGLVTVWRLGGGRLAFTAPPLLRTGRLEASEVGRLSAALGVGAGRVVDHQWVDNGPGWAVLRLATAAEVLALEPELSLAPDAMAGVIGAHPPGSAHAFELRTFAPRCGVPEDPACGSMSAAVGQWLATGGAPAAYRVSQGARLGRAATIEVTTGTDGTVRVGGTTEILVRGTVIL